MQIIVNHLTRMQSGFICAAGIDVSNDQHIRPVQYRGRLSSNLLANNGGPFSIAALVDIGAVEPWGKRPEVEDHLFEPRNARCVRTISPEYFWQSLQNVAQRSLTEIFGPSLRAHRRGCVVDLNTGDASLGCLIPARSPQLYVNSYGKIRARVTDGIFDVDLSVTDIRLCEADHTTPKRSLVQQINSFISMGTPTILSVGLGRPWRHPDDTEKRHWLQVNNIHFKDNTAWEMFEDIFDF